MFNNEKTAGRIMQKVQKPKAEFFNLRAATEKLIKYLYKHRKQAEQAYSRHSRLEWCRIMINCLKTDSLTDIGDSGVAFATENNFHAKMYIGTNNIQKKGCTFSKLQISLIKLSVNSTRSDPIGQFTNLDVAQWLAVKNSSCWPCRMRLKSWDINTREAEKVLGPSWQGLGSDRFMRKLMRDKKWWAIIIRQQLSLK